MEQIIHINFEDLNSDIKKTIENKFTNQLILYHKCTWIDKGNTILSNNPTDVYDVYNNLKINLDLIKNFF